MSNNKLRNRCDRCNEELHPDRVVWLGLDQRTNTYTDQEIPPEHDQGGFPFGRACARQALREHQLAKVGSGTALLSKPPVDKDLQAIRDELNVGDALAPDEDC